MAKLGALHFYPERIAWIGAGMLGGCLILAAPFLFLLSQTESSFFSIKEKKMKEVLPAPITFSLGLGSQGPLLPIPHFEEEMTFSFDPPRPDGAVLGERLLVRIQKSSESKRVILPCRLDLEYQRDKLTFAKEPSSFWIELSLAPGGQIEGRGFILAEEGRMAAGSFIASAQECPIQSAAEFSEGSPFRLLAEARWWGRDQFPESGSGERLEIGSAELLELNQGDWLVWKDQKWQKSRVFEKEHPIAHIQSHSGKALVLQGWDSEGHIRVSLGMAAGPVFKIRGEDLFSAIRIRSEKQISCMLEKQCMVLKTGDWVFKSNGRWKVLRKKDERDAFLNGKLFGELFVFEQIMQKQGQKMIQGRLFNPGRTQFVPIEMAAHSSQRSAGKTFRKGKGP